MIRQSVHMVQSHSGPAGRQLAFLTYGSNAAKPPLYHGELGWELFNFGGIIRSQVA